MESINIPKLEQHVIEVNEMQRRAEAFVYATLPYSTVEVNELRNTASYGIVLKCYYKGQIRGCSGVINNEIGSVERVCAELVLRMHRECLGL